MAATKEELKELFNRDLNRLINNLELIDANSLWSAPEGVENSCGVLTQHLVGNLRHYIGAGLGNTGYKRDREREFSVTNQTRNFLIGEVEELKVTVTETLDGLDDASLDQPYPMDVPYDYSAREFLMHLYGHLNYHLGQINYLRRLQQ